MIEIGREIHPLRDFFDPQLLSGRAAPTVKKLDAAYPASDSATGRVRRMSLELKENCAGKRFSGCRCPIAVRLPQRLSADLRPAL